MIIIHYFKEHCNKPKIYKNVFTISKNNIYAIKHKYIGRIICILPNEGTNIPIAYSLYEIMK